MCGLMIAAMLKNPKLDFVRRELRARRKRGELKVVASETGVKYTTVKNIAGGLVSNPLSANLDALYNYLQPTA